MTWIKDRVKSGHLEEHQNSRFYPVVRTMSATDSDPSIYVHVGNIQQFVPDFEARGKDSVADVDWTALCYFSTTHVQAAPSKNSVFASLHFLIIQNYSECAFLEQGRLCIVSNLFPRCVKG